MGGGLMYSSTYP